jgi:hypothetical protein
MKTKRPSLAEVPLTTVWPPRKGVCYAPMSVGQWDRLLKTAYDLGYVLVEVHENQNVVRAFRTPALNWLSEEGAAGRVRERRGSHWVGRRVELNGVTSPVFINCLEKKLDEHDVCKQVPRHDVLERAFRWATTTAILEAEVNRQAAGAMEAAAQLGLPGRLAGDVKGRLRGEPGKSWDQVIAEIALERVSAKRWRVDPQTEGKWRWAIQSKKQRTTRMTLVCAVGIAVIASFAFSLRGASPTARSSAVVRAVSAAPASQPGNARQVADLVPEQAPRLQFSMRHVYRCKNFFRSALRGISAHVGCSSIKEEATA